MWKCSIFSLISKLHLFTTLGMFESSKYTKCYIKIQDFLLFFYKLKEAHYMFLEDLIMDYKLTYSFLPSQAPSSCQDVLLSCFVLRHVLSLQHKLPSPPNTNQRNIKHQASRFKGPKRQRYDTNVSFLTSFIKTPTSSSTHLSPCNLACKQDK